MTFQETLHTVTSFASMILNAGRIKTIVAETEEQYIGVSVIETTPRGDKWEAVIEEISWDGDCGLNGEWMIYLSYTNHPAGIVGAWVTKEVLTLKGE